jgi:dephospho-CoA kinase
MKIGLTGGIGAGKSAVAARLSAHGAVIVDADAIAREVVAPGTPGLAAIVAEFGDGILQADGALDRAAMAAIVFTDPERRTALEAIVHPLVGARSAELIAAAPAGAVVVYDVPLLAETMHTTRSGGHEFDVVVVVEAPAETRIPRLVARGIPEWDAEARIASQASDEERRALADHVLVNDGSLAELEAAVDALWPQLG